MVKKANRSVYAVWLLLILGCATRNVFAGPKATLKAASNTSSEVTTSARMELSSEELWSNNCQRCHNIRAPSVYTPAQWEIIVHHMRVRANITGAEQRAIADFLRSASR